nr:ATP-binding protein [Novosphingobium resinovorum]
MEDNGSGIAAETLKSIFEHFFTTKGLNKETGLGLSQVRGFAKQSGGEIDAEIGSVLEPPSRFICRSPRLSRSWPSHRPSGAPGGPAHQACSGCRRQ